MDGREERVRDALEGFRTAEALASGAWKVFLGSRMVAPRDFLAERRMVLRWSVLMAEANASVGYKHYAMPHGWRHWMEGAPHTTACGAVAKVEDGHG